MDWLGTPWGALIVLIVVVGLLVLARMGFRIRLPGKGRAGELLPPGAVPEVAQPNHGECKFIGDFLHIISRTAQMAVKEAMSGNELVATQMKYYEERELEIRGVLQRTFVKLLDDACPGSDVVQHPEYISFCAVLEVLRIRIGDFIRVSMRQNHFLDLEGDRWVDYRQAKTIAVIQLGTEVLNDYWRGTAVRRDELYRANHEPGVIGAVSGAVNAVFENARKEAKAKSDELNAARAEYEAYIKKGTKGAVE